VTRPNRSLGPQPEPVESFVRRARVWLEANAERQEAASAAARVADGRRAAERIRIFADPAPDQAAIEVAQARDWQRRKWEAGFAAVSWPAELGGAGLSAAHERAFDRLERDFDTPRRTEVFNVTLGMVAPTLRDHGTEEQKRRFLPTFFRGEALCCQLFSEPEAGSDLASLHSTASRRGDGWQITGQKLWCSGAPYCEWGEAIVRTSNEDDRHAGHTVFLVPMGHPAVESRPIVQMTGGASFHQVFLDAVPVGDDLRLGAVGDGWRVAQATLGYERGGGASLGGGSYRDLIALARALGVAADPLVRQKLAAVYSDHRAHAFFASWAGGGGAVPGAAKASIGKLLFTSRLTEIGEEAAQLLGAAITADTGIAGTYEWTGHLLGSPGPSIAGGTSEIQRNIIAERGLGLPRT
jgi:alkylation response protein AidB-like acyl-CoA dehydrogenase